VATEQAGSLRVLEQSAYRYAIDVTDLVRHGEANVLSIQHRGEAMSLRQYFKEMNPSLDFVFDELAIELSDEPSAVAAYDPQAEFDADRLMAQPPATCDVTQAVTVASDGSLHVSLPGMKAQVVSRFSWQGGGFNTFGDADAPDQQDGWTVRVAGNVVTGIAPEYRVRRTIAWRGDHLEVADELTNRTDADIALAFTHALRLREGEPAQVYLGGNPDPAVPRVEHMENPTVFIATKQAGCGLLARDDVYRMQGVYYFEDGEAGARSDTFSLPANGSYTVRWWLYPVQRDDYFDMINLARRDLEVNFTTEGGFQFGLPSILAMSDEQLRDLIDTRGLKFFSSGVWFDRDGAIACYHGDHMLEASSIRQTLRQACAKLRRVAPDVMSLIYIHTFINTDADGPTKYPDARIVNADGQTYINDGYTQRIGVPFYYMYPRADNGYLDALKRVVDMCLDEDKIDADGIYWDEVEMISVNQSFDQWDGHSAIHTTDHRIERKYGDPHLRSLDAKVQLIEYIRGKGGALIGNSAPRSETLMRTHFARFVETASSWYPARTHLYTPLALGDHLTIEDFDSLLADIRNKLMWGTLYYYYSVPGHPHPTITQHMFPFTPVELHRGWLLGEERIVTAVPGTFTLDDTDEVTVYWYDANGKLTESQGEQRIEDERRLIRLALGKDEMAVIERR
jgi:hypothetical protein